MERLRQGPPKGQGAEASHCRHIDRRIRYKSTGIGHKESIGFPPVVSQVDDSGAVAKRDVFRCSKLRWISSLNPANSHKRLITNRSNWVPKLLEPVQVRAGAPLREFL